MADARGPRLLMDLNNAFKRDPLIDEYDVLPVIQPKHNRSPFIVENHKLGVEAWAVKVLIKYAINRLVGWRSQKPAQKFIDCQDICYLSRAVLLFNPDNYTTWNIRKELVENGSLAVSEDLALGALILTKHPKSPETFIHRRWLFQQLLDSCLSSSSGSNGSCSGGAAATNDESLVNMDAIDIDIGAHPELSASSHFNGAFSLETSRLFKSHTVRELEVCTQAAERYSCNYHAWSHRIWIVKHCLNSSLQVLESELEKSMRWTSNHISDHSGFHYRQFLLNEMDKKKVQRHRGQTVIWSFMNLLVDEMAFIIDLIACYPGHEALWYHRRYVVREQLRHNHQDKVTAGQDGNGSEMYNQTHANLNQSIITQELDSACTHEKRANDCLDKSLCRKYIQWLHRVTKQHL